MDEIGYTRCSTPKGKKDRSYLYLQNGAEAAQMTTVNVDGRHFADQSQVDELKKIIEGLTLQITVLNESLLLAKTPMQPVPPIQTNAPPPPPLPTFNPVPVAAPAPSGGPPPPPPPPPPPMPPAPVGNKPLIIIKKGDQNKPVQKPQMSLFDVLKELPNAKLRSVKRFSLLQLLW